MTLLASSGSPPKPAAGASRKSATPNELAQHLSTSSAWERGEADVEWIQTHISHVFLVGDRVFKMRKSVKMPFLDFESREERNADCLREIALNRRLSPDVYLGVAPILDDEQGVRVGPLSEQVLDSKHEHFVVMRRLPKGRDAQALLLAGRLEPKHLEAVAERLAGFHAAQSLGRPSPWSAESWLERIASPIRESLTVLSDSGVIADSAMERVTARIEERLEENRADFEARRQEGRAVDAHGDLHLDHIWYESDEAAPLLVDCLEFNEDLRHIDSAGEVAFLAMDLRYRGATDLAEWFLATYAMHADDYGLFPVVDVFAAYRALVRGKVAALASAQSSLKRAQRERARESAKQHVALAEALLDRTPKPGLVLLCGTVGSGKSTVAKELAQSGQGIPIVSDRVRKAILGVPAEARLGDLPDEGLYEPRKIEGVYRGLLERAGSVVESGRVAILDAGFASRARRDEARRWAVERGLSARLIEVRCSPDTARERLARRAEAGNDPSDAGPEFLRLSLDRFEPPDEWPEEDHEVVWTD